MLSNNNATAHEQCRPCGQDLRGQTPIADLVLFIIGRSWITSAVPHLPIMVEWVRPGRLVFYQSCSLGGFTRNDKPAGRGHWKPKACALGLYPRECFNWSSLPLLAGSYHFTWKEYWYFSYCFWFHFSFSFLNQTSCFPCPHPELDWVLHEKKKKETDWIHEYKLHFLWINWASTKYSWANLDKNWLADQNRFFLCFWEYWVLISWQN